MHFWLIFCCLLGCVACQRATIDPGPWTKVDTVATSNGSIKATLAGSRRVLKPGDTLEITLTLEALDPIRLVSSDRTVYDITISEITDKVVGRWSAEQPPGSANQLTLAQGEQKKVTFRWLTPSQPDAEETYVVTATIGGNSLIFPIIVNQTGNP